MQVFRFCSGGGKSGATTVKTDNDFKVLIDTLKFIDTLKCKNTKPNINIAIDLNECGTFLRRKRVSFCNISFLLCYKSLFQAIALEDAEPHNGQDTELVRRTKVCFCTTLLNFAADRI